MTPEQFYQHQLQQKAIQADPAQAAVVTALESLYTRLIQAPAPAPEPDLLRRLLKRKTHHLRPPVTGLYLWGGDRSVVGYSCGLGAGCI